MEAQKTQAGKDFGELVRERRRHRGLPVPVADKVLPFRLHCPLAPEPSARLAAESPAEGEVQVQEAERVAKVRLAAAWLRLAEAEQLQVSPQEVRELEIAYLQEVESLAAARARR